MAGFSIALVLGVFYLTFLAILIGIFICMVLTYIFDSLAFYGMAKKKGLNHAFTAWIPFYHKVLFGRITGKNTLGILSAICNVLALACLLSRFENLYLTYVCVALFVASLVAGFVFDLLMASVVYKSASKKYGDVFTIASALTLGFARPIILFALREKVTFESTAAAGFSEPTPQISQTNA